MPFFKPSLRLPGRAGPVSAAAALSALLLAAVILLLPAAADASTQSRLDQTRSKIQKADQERGVLTDQIARLGTRIRSFENELAGLRAREHRVAVRLAAKQAELNEAESDVKQAYSELQELAERLRRALKVLTNRLIAIYQSGPTSTTELVLSSRSYGDLIERSTYFTHIQDRDQNVAGRVRDLRDTQKKLVIRLKQAKERIESARDEIATTKARLTSARSAVEQRQGQLASVRASRRSSLASVNTRVNHLEQVEADLQRKIQEQLAAAGGYGTLPAGPMTTPSAAGLIWPVSGTLSSGFGGRSSPGGIGSTNHAGIDIAVPEGTPIRAAKGGTVVLAAYTGGYGNYTCIDHGSSLSTCYAHQSRFAVSVGQRVSQGQVIGYSGNTGASTGPHLHFEVRIGGVPQDPMGYL